MSRRNIREKSENRDAEETSSDEEYRGSRGSGQGWGSDNEWNEDSSLAGEASGMSEGSEEEQPEEEEEKMRENKNPKKDQNIKPTRLNLDDVGTEDDGESRHPEDITEKTDGRYSKTIGSDVSDMSEIEDQIAETHHKFMDDKQSLSGVMGLVDQVTTKGETLTKKASETSLVVERDAFKKSVLSNDQFSLFDDDEMSFRSYTDRTDLEEDHIPQRDLGKMPPGRIEYMNDSKENLPKQTFGLGQIEYLDETKSSDSGSLISEQVDTPINVVNKDDDEEAKSKMSERPDKRQEEDLPLEGKSGDSSDRSSVKSSKSSETFISKISNTPEAKETGSESENEKDRAKEEVEDLSHEQDDENEEKPLDSSEGLEFKEPECSKYGEKHLCCYINLGGGGDDGRGNELVNRLKKLKDDIANMRKELSLARQECKKESEEVAKLIEEAAARNKAAEQNEIAISNSANVFPAYGAPKYVQEIVPTVLTQPAILPRTQVAIPTVLLEERLRATRQNASSTYRESLKELERMVEKEMASIQDSMIRLEPLNKIAAEWDAVLPIRDPKITTYKSDYKLEMVTSEMRLQGPDVKNAAMQEI